ncbi:potassium transporter TrkG [Janibacter alkaliphilus]|uniref:Potassium uptake TrkH family protein n=1 Tax=Janibacter alkaliphilus TaxID=1069963 RepID=A0A852X9L5_9MICO|nr:potassium uptake TrkH family protein [Janibacter alkaliphilus]
MGHPRAVNSHLLNRLVANPARTVMLGFAGVIAVGTVLLALPVAAEPGQRTDLITALFTSTSATCVTGLVTVDTATHWSAFGEVVILVLIEIGGLGVMTAASLLLLAVGRRLGAASAALSSAESRAIPREEVREVIVTITRISAAVQVLVAASLAVRLATRYDLSPGEAAYSGVFHSISAYNNAGFGLREDSITPYAADPWVCVPLMVAVMLGGLGFPVLWHLRRRLLRPGQWSVHVMITVWGSVVLWVVGALVLALFEWHNPRTLGALDPGARLLTATFQSVAARTAGFNSVPIGDLHPESLLALDVLMFIGGGSAGTAGGLKITTFAVLGFVIWAELRGEPTVRTFHRRLPASIQRSALSVALLSVAVVVVATGALLVLTNATLDEVLFEAVSAFATVGMSTGLTTELPPAAELVVIALMFLGRLGPITLGAALALRTRPRRFEVPEERVTVG